MWNIFKVNNKTPEPSQRRRSGVFINFEHISYLFLFLFVKFEQVNVSCVKLNLKAICMLFKWRFVILPSLMQFRQFCFIFHLKLPKKLPRLFWKLQKSMPHTQKQTFNNTNLYVCVLGRNKCQFSGKSKNSKTEILNLEVL